MRKKHLVKNKVNIEIITLSLDLQLRNIVQFDL